jgi:hypothetical protein
MPNGNQPQGAEWWGLFVFLIPFEAIGLLMFLALWAALLEPVRRSVWTFASHSVEQRLSWLGVGPRWTWWVESLDRIELARKGKGAWRGLQGAARGVDPEGDGRVYALSLVDCGNSELCSIVGLTEGEARWIADTLLRERAGWFRRRRPD